MPQMSLLTLVRGFTSTRATGAWGCARTLRLACSDDARCVGRFLGTLPGKSSLAQGAKAHTCQQHAQRPGKDRVETETGKGEERISEMRLTKRSLDPNRIRNFSRFLSLCASLGSRGAHSGKAFHIVKQKDGLTLHGLDPVLAAAQGIQRERTLLKIGWVRTVWLVQKL